jgi:NTP pyrophosphatase (non-canonical NTP hydrolase)
MGISAVSTGKYKVYHILGKKIGCTKNIKKRVEQEQGYKPGEYEILFETDDIKEAAKAEKTLQQDLGYKVDIKPYDKLFNKEMKKVNITEQTTTFAISKEDINGSFLGDLQWETPYGVININATDKIEWIIDNVKTSMFNANRCYVYNKAMHEASPFQKHKEKLYSHQDQFELIREWAKERGLYDKGNATTQYVKLQEEAGELAKALLKNDQPEVIDAIGDMVVVLTNLAYMRGVNIESCISSAYDVISKRTGKMVNGTFVKDIEVVDPQTISAYPDPGPPPSFVSNRT